MKRYFHDFRIQSLCTQTQSGAEDKTRPDTVSKSGTPTSGDYRERAQVFDFAHERRLRALNTIEQGYTLSEAARLLVSLGSPYAVGMITDGDRFAVLFALFPAAVYWVADSLGVGFRHGHSSSARRADKTA